MKEQMKSFTILISHALDVVIELESIERAIKRFNDLFSEFLNITLKTCKWESNSFPTNLCDRPQGGVNDQLVATSDLCIAIFRTRFGIPRGGKDKNGVEYQSGTEEEIGLMTEQKKPVFAYFLNEECINLKGLDTEQYEKVKKFRNEYGKKYLYSIYNKNEDSYKTESDLEYQLFNHLCNYFIKNKEFIKTNINDDLYLNLLGGFSKENTNDLEILKYLTQSSDDQIKLMIERLLCDVRIKNEKSVYQVSENCISVTKRYEFWRQNGCDYNDKSLIERFQDIAKQVLSDPAIYSESLIIGINEALALIKNHFEVFTNLKAVNNISNNADNVVYSLFFEYGNEEKCRIAFEKLGNLNSTKNILSILAEASPEYFLKAIDSALKNSEFKYCINLLWALERLAWDSRYVVHVCATLAELSKHNSTGFIGNVDSPIHSIQTILRSSYVYEDNVQKIWDEKKLAAINLIIAKYPKIASKILINLLFDHGFIFGITERNGKEYPSTFPEFMQLEMQYEYPNHVSNKLYNDYLSLALKFAKDEIDALKQLIINLDECSEELIDDIIKLLDSEMVKNLEDKELYELWSELKSFITKNRYFKTSEWAIGETCINKIEIAANHIAPKNKALKASWYFVNNDITEEPWDCNDYDFNAEDKNRSQIRKAQVNDLILSDSIGSIVTLYEICKESDNYNSYSIALTLSELNDSKIDNVLMPNYLCSEVDRNFISYYINMRFKDKKSASCFIEEVKNEWNNEQICDFVSSLSFKLPIKKLTELLGDCVSSYWEKTHIITSDTQVLEKYLLKERYDLLFNCFHVYADNINSDIIINTLKKIYSCEKLPVSWWTINEQVKRILSIENIDINIKENLEWLSLKYYSPYNHPFVPTNLFRKLDCDSQYLCGIINEAYTFSSHFKKGSACYLLWLWCPNFENIPKFYEWYSKIIGMLDTDPAEYFQKYLGKKLFRRDSDAKIIWFDESSLRVINDSPIVANSYSAAARGMGDLDDLRLGCHNKEYYDTLKSEAPYWRAKAEEVDNLGYFKFATTLRLMADYMEKSDW